MIFHNSLSFRDFSGFCFPYFYRLDINRGSQKYEPIIRNWNMKTSLKIFVARITPENVADQDLFQCSEKNEVLLGPRAKWQWTPLHSRVEIYIFHTRRTSICSNQGIDQKYENLRFKVFIFTDIDVLNIHNQKRTIDTF